MNQYDKTIFTGNLDITPDGLEGLVTSAGLDFISLKVIYEVEHRPPPPTNRILRGRLRITAPNGDELGRIYYRENKQSITVWLEYCDWENAGPEAATRAIIHGWNPHPEKAEIFERLKKVLIAYLSVPEQAGGNEKRPIKPAAPGQAGGDGTQPIKTDAHILFCREKMKSFFGQYSVKAASRIIEVLPSAQSAADEQFEKLVLSQ